jgi:hypothetical protein
MTASWFAVAKRELRAGLANTDEFPEVIIPKATEGPKAVVAKLTGVAPPNCVVMSKLLKIRPSSVQLKPETSTALAVVLAKQVDGSTEFALALCEAAKDNRSPSPRDRLRRFGIFMAPP